MAPYFSGAKSLSPYLLEGALVIRWYGATMALGLLAAIWAVLHRRAITPQFSENQILGVIIWAIIGGFIGARLLFVVLKWPLYSQDLISILQINEGGLSLHGALIGGAAATAAFCYLYRLNWARMADLLIVGLPIGQAIGRFGNFFNQEAFGGVTNLPWKMYVAPEFRPSHLGGFDFFHPTFIYEAVGNLVIFWYLLRQQTPHHAGRILLQYLMLYSCLRFVVEFFRIDSDRIGSLSVAQWASLGIVAVAVILLNRSKSKSL